MIYVDNAATTKIDDEVLKVMMPYLTDYYGNASTVYKIGRKCRKAIEDSRKDIAKVINCKPNEIFFTSGATESNNWALKGVLKAYKRLGKHHLITTKVEHHSVLNTALELEKEGFEVTYLDVDHDGHISLEQLENSIKEDTALVSIMYVNNETGVINPVKEIADICHQHQVLFHCDSVQAIGLLNIDVKEEHIDLLSASAHKFYGPKGIGFLYINSNVKIDNLLNGGSQEKNLRPGTENVAYIKGMAYALQLANKYQKERFEHLTILKDYLVTNLSKIDDVSINGTNTMPHILNILFKNIDAQSLLMELDIKEIYASSGSACSYGETKPSHVLLAMGLDYVSASGCLRISLGKDNDLKQMEELVANITNIIKYLKEEEL